MEKTMRKVLTTIQASAEIIVDYQRDKAFRDYPVTLMALAISSMCRWGME
jgi:hypothetical protein